MTPPKLTWDKHVCGSMYCIYLSSLPTGSTAETAEQSMFPRCYCRLLRAHTHTLTQTESLSPATMLLPLFLHVSLSGVWPPCFSLCLSRRHNLAGKASYRTFAYACPRDYHKQLQPAMREELHNTQVVHFTSVDCSIAEVFKQRRNWITVMQSMPTQTKAFEAFSKLPTESNWCEITLLRGINIETHFKESISKVVSLLITPSGPHTTANPLQVSPSKTLGNWGNSCACFKCLTKVFKVPGAQCLFKILSFEIFLFIWGSNESNKCNWPWSPASLLSLYQGPQ